MKICLKCSSNINNDKWHCPSCGWSPEYQNGIPLFSPELASGGVSYPTQSHDKLAKLEENNFWFISRNRLLGYLLDKYFSDTKNFLEIGCGNGFVLSGLAEFRPDMDFFGAEAYTFGLQHAQKRLPNANFAQMDAHRIPFKEEFDVIGSFDVLEHIKDDQSVLSQMHKALKPGGGLMITVPQHTWLWSKTDEKAGHLRRYTRTDLISKLSDAKFDVVKTTSFIALLLPFMMASRFMKKNKKSDDKGSDAGLCLPQIINTPFLKICDLERMLIKIGLPMPWGGSLVCVARKRKTY